MNNLLGELSVMDNLDIKPNYAELGRKYGMDWRTVKKYHLGYKGKPASRIKKSKLDQYSDEIADRLKLNRVSVTGVYHYMVSTYGIENIGTYANFNYFVKQRKLASKNHTVGHPRFETEPGEQAQVDWKESITLKSRDGTEYEFNIFHLVLKFSRYSYLELSFNKRTYDVNRCLINAFKYIGGVPDELLFDNMTTVVTKNGASKSLTSAIHKFAADFSFKVRTCKIRSPETKGTCEARNKILDWIRAYDGKFDTVEELTDQIQQINKTMNIQICQETNISPIALFYKEKEYLHALPISTIIDDYLKPNKYTVGDDSLIRYGSNKYSAPPDLIGQDVNIDVFDEKLHIYYNGKMVGFHPLAKKPISYMPEHYKKIMAGKVKETELDKVATDNLKIMDTILEKRSTKISTIDASKCFEALISFISQYECGRWIVNYLAVLPESERLVFVRNVSNVLPYVKNPDEFVSNLKHSMKDDMCRTIDYDCYIHDFMPCNELILTEEGYNIIGERYKDDITKYMNELAEEYNNDSIPHDAQGGMDLIMEEL